MNWKNIYNNLINRAKPKGLTPEKGYEIHHILPRCMGGNDDPENLVKLSYREHFVSHQILARMHKTQNLIMAANMMSNFRKYTSKEYSWLKNQVINLGGKYHKGKTYKDIVSPYKLESLLNKRKEQMVYMNAMGIIGGRGESNPMHKSNEKYDDEFYKIKSLKAYETRRKRGNDKHTETTKNKIKETLLNNNHCAKMVYIYSKDKKLIRTFKSLTETAKYFNMSNSGIHKYTSNPEKLFKNENYLSYERL